MEHLKVNCFEPTAISFIYGAIFKNIVCYSQFSASCQPAQDQPPLEPACACTAPHNISIVTLTVLQL